MILYLLLLDANACMHGISSIESSQKCCGFRSSVVLHGFSWGVTLLDTRSSRKNLYLLEAMFFSS